MGVDGVGLDVVATGGKEVEPFQVRCVDFWVFGQSGEGYEDCGMFEEGWRWGFVSLGMVVDYVDVWELRAQG